MANPTPFWVPNPDADYTVDISNKEEIQHEVLFEEGLNTIRYRPLFIGRTFHKMRFIVAALIAAVSVTGLIGRAAWMQFVQTETYQQQAEANRLRTTPYWPKRGVIRDRQGRPLVVNIPSFRITMTPQDLFVKRDEREQEMGEVSRILGLSLSDIMPIADATGTAREENVLIADHVPYEKAMAMEIALPHLPGFDLETRPIRQYPYSNELPSLSHVLGYVGKLSADEYKTQKANGYRHTDEIGKIGVERSYESALRGVLGAQVSEVDAFGHVKAMVGNRPAQDGQDVTLSIDLDLQRAAEKALRDEMRAAGVTRGAVVAMDPRDGSILALVSLPAFDNNQFSGSVSSTLYTALVNNPDQPLFPRAWAGTYPSGSTVKIVISTAALMEHVITPNTTVLSVGGIHVGPWFFPDWKAGGHGVTNVRKAIAWSINTFFYTVGGGYESFVGLGVDRLGDWMRRFGLGSKSNLDLPAEATGFVPTKEWKQKTQGTPWFVGDTYNLSIGQGDLLVTPMQVANYTAAIANSGTLVTPHVVGRIGDTSSTAQVLPRSTHLADQDVLETVRLGMRDCVTYGSCRALSSMSFPVAGKTGTAQWNSKKKTHAWFTSFAPFENPEVVVTVLLEEGGEGSSVSVPVARQVLQAWWDLRAKRGGSF